MSKTSAAIAAVSAELSELGIGKDRNNAAQGFKFRGIDDVLNVVAPIYAKHGLIVVPRFEGAQTIERRFPAKDGKSEKVLLFSSVQGYFLMMHKDEPDTYLQSGPFPGEAMDSADKAMNKAMSASYKYFVLMTFAVPVVGTPDSDADDHGVAPVVQEVDVEMFRAQFDTLKDVALVRAALIEARRVCREANNAEALAEIDKIAKARADALGAAKKEAK